MRTPTRNAIRFLLPLSLLLLFLAGCGGTRGGPAGAAGASGGATFTVVWPEPSRLIPEASNSIKVEIQRGQQVVASQILTRPPGGGPASATFSPLPVGDLLAVATAYPDAGAGGVAQAQGSVPLTIRAGQHTSFVLTMESTIDRLELLPASPSVQIGRPVAFTVTARDRDDRVVLIALAKTRWELSDPAAATIDAQGRFVALKDGPLTLTVTETESGRSAAVSLAVPPLPENVRYNPANGHYYEQVPGVGVVHAEAKAAAESRTLFGLRGHLLTITSQAEMDFLVASFSLGGYRVGCYQDRSAPDYSEPAGGWRWTTDEPFVYTNWNHGEPNNVGGGEDFASFFPHGHWNDVYDDDTGSGYFIEYE